MKNKSTKLTLLLTIILLMLAGFAPAAQAADGLTLQIQAKVSAQNMPTGHSETYILRITAKDADSPMPHGQFGGSYDMSLNGLGTALFPTIEYTAVGEYSYEISQLEGNYTNCEYDRRSYTVKIYVTNSSDGGYDISWTIREDDTGTKPDYIEFVNVYKKSPSSSGGIVGSGVNDRYLFYFAGSILLLAASAILISFLCRREEE